MKMKEVHLIRLEKTKKEITGALLYKDENNSMTTLYTLELADKNNQQNISCIPKGAYTCIFTYSAKFKKFTYELLKVANRKGIRIHSLNYYTQTKGCIGIGTKKFDVNKDGELDLLDSRKAIQKFEDTMKKQPFKLIIK